MPLGSVDEDPEERGLSNHGWLRLLGHFMLSQGWGFGAAGMGGRASFGGLRPTHSKVVVSEHPEVAVRVPVCWYPKGR